MVGIELVDCGSASTTFMVRGREGRVPVPLRDGRFWLIQALILIVEIGHDDLENRGMLDPTSSLYLPLTSVVLIPLVYSALSFGVRKDASDYPRELHDDTLQALVTATGQLGALSTDDLDDLGLIDAIDALVEELNSSPPSPPSSAARTGGPTRPETRNDHLPSRTGSTAQRRATLVVPIPR